MPKKEKWTITLKGSYFLTGSVGPLKGCIFEAGAEHVCISQFLIFT